MLSKKPIKRPEKLSGCEPCIHRQGDFKDDTVDPNIIRVYCQARHVDVDVAIMAKECDFFKLDPLFQRPQEDNRYGL